MNNVRLQELLGDLNNIEKEIVKGSITQRNLGIVRDLINIKEKLLDLAEGAMFEKDEYEPELTLDETKPYGDLQERYCVDVPHKHGGSTLFSFKTFTEAEEAARVGNDMNGFGPYSPNFIRVFSKFVKD